MPVESCNIEATPRFTDTIPPANAPPVHYSDPPRLPPRRYELPPSIFYPF